MLKSVKAMAVAVTLGTSILAVPSAAEASSGRCGYPYVCLYTRSMSHPTSRFRDVTPGWQWLSRSFGARSFRNTRHDDVAYILTTTGRTICVRPGATGGLMDGGATAIRISYRSHC